MAKIREVLVVAHTHHDVGYTHSPRLLLPIHWQAVREAVRLAGEPATDDASAFRWTIENSRPVVEFLDRASPAEVAALAVLAQRDRISITGGYLNSTQLVGHEELVRSYEVVDRLRRAGLPVHVVQHSDINGIPWGTVPAMVRAGLDVLVMAINPDHGRPPFEQPTAFWWEGPDGSRILAWLSLHYGLAEMWGLLDGEIERFGEGLRSVVARIEARDDYPFNFIVLHATDDNGWPTRHAADGVRAWNDRHPELRLSTATIDGAMRRALVQAQAAPLPTWRGEWADWWAHGHGSTAYEVGVGRTARSLLRTAETALAVARLEDGAAPTGERRSAWRRDPIRLRGELEVGAAVAAVYDDLLVFEEHTWGADESVSRPDSVFTRSHWNAKAAFAFSAYDRARDLAVEAMWRLAAGQPAGAERSMLVFNPLPTTRTAPVSVDVDGVTSDVLVRDVPGYGLVAVPLPAADAVVRESGSVLETDRFRVTVDPARGGIVSLVDRAMGWDLVDPAGSEPLGAVLVEAIDATVDHPILHEGRRHFAPATPGPSFIRTVAAGNATPVVERGAGWSAITWTASAPTLPVVQGRLMAYDGQDGVQLQVSIAKLENRDPEGVYVAFPFALDRPTFWLETAGAVYRAGIDQLPDTCLDWQSIQHAAGVTDGRRSVLWTTREAPLVQLGEIHTGQWARHLDASTGHLYAWLMNNLYFTNFKAEQGGTESFTFTFSARPGPIDADMVRRFGEGEALPLVARVVDGAGSNVAPPLAVKPPDLTAVALALDPDGRSVRVRLQASARGGPAELCWNGPGRLAAWRADVFGNRMERLDGDGRLFRLTLAPHELATVVLEPTPARAPAG
jgi:hypothetical protein